MPDILLIQPPIRDFYLTAKRTIPYGLACIASALMDSGFSVEILDCLATSRSRKLALPDEMAYLEKYYGKHDISPFALFHQFKHFGRSFGHIGEAARKSGAFLVGISSLFTAYSEEALHAARVVKESLPRCALALGGHHPTEMPEEAMRCEAVDYVLRGEGEASMPALAKALKSGSSLKSVPGIVYRDSQGGIVSSAPAYAHRLDAQPAPAIDLIDHRFYRRSGKGSAVITASRGCPMRCSYCSVGAASGIPYRRRSLESALSEIDRAVNVCGAGFLDFEDENISMEKEWFLDLLEAVKERYGERGIELRAMNGLFPPSLDERAIRAMKDAGFRTLNLSLGTASPEQAKRFRRPLVKEAFDEALHYAEKYGLDAVGYIIVGAPGQEAECSLSDLAYLARRRVLAGVSVYYPSPGSEDYAKCRAMGILPDKLSLMRSTAIPISEAAAREESVTLLRLGRILNFMKSLIDSEESLPRPRTLDSEASKKIDPADRLKAGKSLLQAFLADGVIRGITPEGEIFEHIASKKLTTSFIDSLGEIRGFASGGLFVPFVENDL